MNPQQGSPADYSVTPTQCIGTLIDHGWLYRKVQLPDPINATVTYDGRGFGFESILVDGQLVTRKTNLLWFVPHFDFVVSTTLGDLAGSIDVRIKPWLTLASIVIAIEGKEVYTET